MWTKMIFYTCSFSLCVRKPKKLRSSSSNNYFEARMLFWFDGEWLKFETGKLMTIQEWETKWTMCRHPIQRRAISKHWLRIICLFQHCGFRYTIWPLFLLSCAALIESRIVLWHLAIGPNAFDNDILPWWSTQFVLLCAEIQVNRHTKSKHSNIFASHLFSFCFIFELQFWRYKMNCMYSEAFLHCAENGTDRGKSRAEPARER